MVGRVRGGSGSPELAGDGGRSSGGVASIQGSLVAFRAWSLRGMGGKREAFKTAWSRRGINATLKRIQLRHYWQETAAVSGEEQVAGGEDDRVAVGSTGSEREGKEKGSTSQSQSG